MKKRILRAATQEDPKDNNSLSLLLYEGRKEKSMIKVEKTGNKMELEIKGDTHDLICEFDAVLKAMCERTVLLLQNYASEASKC